MLNELNAALGERYRVDRELGRGGMASVWLAWDLRHERPVALKVLHPELAGAIGVDRFLREVRFTARVQHPNIVPVLDSGVITGSQGIALPWYAMGYVAGESLRQRLQRERQLPIGEAIGIVEQAGAALTAAHRAGIVHRDIKPENLLLADGSTYVADFGIAKALLDTGTERLTSTGLAIGTPAYMSPEQATADSVDPRTDQYSLASVLYEMLAGEPPFTGPTAQAVVARRLTEPARRVRPVRSSVPLPVEEALLTALERVPADRFPDMASFAAALRSGSSANRSGRHHGPFPRRRMVGTLVGVVLTALLGLALLRLARPRGPAPQARDSVAVALMRRGAQAMARRTPDAAKEAVQSFSGALMRDSTYAEAWAGLASTYAQAYGRRFVAPGAARDSVLRLAVAAAERAVALEPGSAKVWVARASVNRLVDPTNLAPALRDLDRALALDSGNARAWHLYALSHAENGAMDAAMAAWHRAVAADPSYTEALAFLGIGFYWRRQYDSAARWADSAVAAEPTYLLGRTTVGQVAVERGDAAKALAAFEAGRRLTTEVEEVNTLAGIALVEARAGATRDARRTLARAESLAVPLVPAPSHTALYLAHAYAALGEPGQAMAWLRRVTPAGDRHFQLHLQCDPPLDPLAKRADFRSLVSRERPEGGC